MLVSHDHRFIYLKTTKTAGTSVEAALQPFAAPQGADENRDITAPIVSERGIVGARGKNARRHEWYNHMPAFEVKRKIGEEKWNSYFKFCNVRNPWDKTVSWFHFRNPDACNLNKTQLITKFQQELLKADKIMRDFHVYTIKEELAIDGYIRYNSLSYDLNAILDLLEIPRVDLPHLKATHRGDNRIPYQEYYDKESYERIAKLYQKEIEMFGWVF